jgi:Mg2+ and Co2+ transporter CorA
LNELDVIIWDNYIITTTSLESQTFNYLCESIKNESEEIWDDYKTSPYYILYRIIDTFYDKTIKSLAISSKALLTIQNNIADRKIEKW